MPAKPNNEITADERLLLQAISIAWQPVTQTEMHELARGLKMRTADGKSFGNTDIRALRESLVERGLIRRFEIPSGNGFQIPGNAQRELLVREAVAEGSFETLVRLVTDVWPSPDMRHSFVGTVGRHTKVLQRDFRIALYRGDEKAAAELYGNFFLESLRPSFDTIRGLFFLFPFQADRLKSLPREKAAEILPRLYQTIVQTDDSTAEFWRFVDENKLAGEPSFRSLRGFELLLTGDLEACRKHFGWPSGDESLDAVVLRLLEGDDAAAVEAFPGAIATWRKLSRKRAGYPNTWQAALYAAALYRFDQEAFPAFAYEFVNSFKRDDSFGFVPQMVKALGKYASEIARREEPVGLPAPHGIGEQLAAVVLAALVPNAPVPDAIGELEALSARHGFKWPLYEIANLRRLRSLARHATTPSDDPPFALLGRAVKRPDPWERRLNALLAAAEQVAPAEIPEKKSKEQVETRVVWLVDPEEYEVKAVEQRLQNGKWSGGRSIAAKKLYDDKVPNLGDRDRVVAKAAIRRGYSPYGNNYDLDFDKAIVALCGHPQVFLMAEPDVRVNLVLTEPTLVVVESPDGFEIRFDVEFYQPGVVVRRETATIYHVVKVETKHVRIAQTMDSENIVVPAQGRAKLVAATRKLASVMNVRSDLGDDLDSLPPVEPDLRTRVLITPTGDWFRVEMFTKPFGSVPPFFRPGLGALNVASEVDGERRRLQRDHVEERERAAKLVAALPSLEGARVGDWDWDLGGVEPLLALLADLETPRAAGDAVVEWTGGKPVTYRGKVDYGNVSVSVRRPLKVHGKGWFDFDARIRIDEKLVIPIRDLIRKMSPDSKGYVELDDGQFLLLSERLRKKLAELDVVVDSKGRINELQSGLLEELESEAAEFVADESWREHVARLRAAGDFVPVLPSTLDAELRPYQREGFDWLARLAHLGFGACLADDMGLGKTVQALALMLDRAASGPQLVVAPVSVGRNWISEMRRFAPTLNGVLFSEAEDRAAQVAALGAFDVVVTSYNLLQSNAELFASRKFATVVLDEAQAIKNRGTQRSKAAMSLDADFRLLTTGTPIENNLAELWNLFNFINPGLLGGYDYFYDRFAVPIERDRSESARRTLRKIVAPFVLRRRKNEVLEDLPPKTEIVLTVELTAEERAQYEAVRREAAERIEAGIDPDMRFQILAELTKLRLASCHPRLVGGKSKSTDGGGGKLDLFGATVDELVAGRHRALVFSQFVKHLDIVREYLDRRGTIYQYLDGSTPPAKRQQAIDDFQRGVGDLFLISLRAGGTGLNLTAADYVIHLDPWWNPAVEDQATDRTHRIGQTRPVTVYRLVASGTVEEKILKLHESKRELADSLLDESSTAGALNLEELRELILS